MDRLTIHSRSRAGSPGRSACAVLGALALLALRLLSAENPPATSPDRVQIAIETLSRLKGIDLEANPTVKAAVRKVLDQVRDRPELVDLARDFQIRDENPALLTLAQKNASNTIGAEAVRLVLEYGGDSLLESALEGTNALATAQALSRTGDKRIVPLLAPLVADTKKDAALRKQAVRALAQTREGARTLLDLVKTGQLSSELQFLTGNELRAARWPEIRAESAELLPPPQAGNDRALPPLAELLTIKGDARRGESVFFSEAVGCAKCHQINGRGTDVGPQLSEIGVKLAKEALYEAILDPSAGISFGFEAYRIELKDGDEVFGLIVSETADELTVKLQTGTLAKFAAREVSQKVPQRLSLMPEGLQRSMTVQELVDLIEYLASLKKAVP